MPDNKIIKSAGTTEGERHLAILAERSFLQLWSWPNLFKEPGKELCDLVIISGNDIVLFSEKTCAFPSDPTNIKIGWKRWFDRSIWRAAAQLKGAERWLRQHPDKVYLDPKCTKRIPMSVPSGAAVKFHRVVVANGAAAACRKWFDGGSGSLVLATSLKGTSHLADQVSDANMFSVGDIDPQGSFIHVWNDDAFEIVMAEFDTILDFLDYLRKKEKFMRRHGVIRIGGEEELIGYFFQNYRPETGFGFELPIDCEAESFDVIDLGEGYWQHLVSNPQYLARKEENQISYLWDRLISKFAHHILAGSILGHEGALEAALPKHEQLIRRLSLETRFGRRVLSDAVIGLLNNARGRDVAFRSGKAPNFGGNAGFMYVFLCVRQHRDLAFESYRLLRRRILLAYCEAMKLRNHRLQKVIGLAFDPIDGGPSIGASEDCVLVDFQDWTPARKAAAKAECEALNIMIDLKMSKARHADFPLLPDHEPGLNRHQRRTRKAQRRRQ